MIIKDNMANMCAKVTSTYMEFTLAFGPKPEFSFSFKLYFIIVLFQYTILGDREQVFPLYYNDFFEQICSDVQFISPPEEEGEFLLHLLKEYTFVEHAKARSRKKPLYIPTDGQKILSLVKESNELNGDYTKTLYQE